MVRAARFDDFQVNQLILVIHGRHGSHVDVLSHAVICALGLGHNPSAVDDNILFLEVRLKFDHANLPPRRKYEPSMGFVMTMSETAEMLGMFASFVSLYRGALINCCRTKWRRRHSREQQGSPSSHEEEGRSGSGNLADKSTRCDRCCQGHPTFCCCGKTSSGG